MHYQILKKKLGELSLSYLVRVHSSFLWRGNLGYQQVGRTLYIHKSHDKSGSSIIVSLNNNSNSSVCSVLFSENLVVVGGGVHRMHITRIQQTENDKKPIKSVSGQFGGKWLRSCFKHIAPKVWLPLFIAIIIIVVMNLCIIMYPM